MAAAGLLYVPFWESLAEARISLLADSIKVSLHTSLYVPSQDNHKFKSDLTTEVASGGGYTTGGVVLTGKTFVKDPVTNRYIFDCDDPTWASATITAAFAVFYDNTPATDATRPLIGYIDFGGNQASAAPSSFVIIVPSTGAFYIQAA